MSRLPAYGSTITSSTASISEEGDDLPTTMAAENNDNNIPGLDVSYTDDSSNPDSVTPLTGGGAAQRKPRILRQRNSGITNGMESVKDDSTGSAGEYSPIVPQRARKHSDFDEEVYNNGSGGDRNKRNNGKLLEGTLAQQPVGRLRTREQIVLHFKIELCMLWRDSVVIFLGTVMQWVHSVITNIAYYYHTQLSAAQRIPLKDIAYETLPVLNGALWVVSEYFVYTIIGTFALATFSILLVRWRAPHGKPLYCVPILRRMFITLVACQVLRCISFLITTLPGASRQCLYNVPEDMSRDELIYGPAPDRGNPPGWAPPQSVNDILWRIDATNGCGDLMFSSHTIFTMLFVLLVWEYFSWGILKWFMVLNQIIIIPFILAAHKHYSIDVFTALYVTPLIFEYFKMKFPDLDVNSADMASHYGIRFRRAYLNGDKQSTRIVIMNMRGEDYPVELADVPLDLQRSSSEKPTPTSLAMPNWEEYSEDDQYSTSELDPIIV